MNFSIIMQVMHIFFTEVFHLAAKGYTDKVLATQQLMP
jgi:hypothetical protein